jgi:glycosyltransferase involved in cell wall biosynthesis
VVSRAMAIASIMHVHGDLDRHLPPAYVQRLANADHVAVVSESVRRSLVEVAGRTRPIDVVPNGLAPLPAELADLSSDDPPIVAMVGRLEPTKGFHDGLSAMALVGRRVPAARMVVVGRGPEAAALAAHARQLGLDGKLEVHEHLPHEACMAMLRRSSVVLVPATRTESFSLVAAEAGLCGRPVVATDVGGLSSTVVDGVTGTVVPPEAPSALAEAVVRYLEDPELASQHGRAGRLRVQEQFTIKGYADRMYALYRGILDGAAD